MALKFHLRRNTDRKVLTNWHAIQVPPTKAPPTSNFWPKFPALGATAGCCIYVLDCLNAFRAFESVVTGVVDRDVKKFAAGLLLWNDRTGADLKAVFEAPTSTDVSLNGCRTVNAIFIKLL